MGLIAVDKLNRKVLGYLCRNNDVLAYCCSTCDIEFKRSNDLEAHMDQHEAKPSNLSETDTQIVGNSPCVEDTVINEDKDDRNVATEVEIDGKDINAVNDDIAVQSEENPNFSLDTSSESSNVASGIDKRPKTMPTQVLLPTQTPTPTPMLNSATQHMDLKGCSVTLVRCDELAKAMEALQSAKMKRIDDSFVEEEEEENDDQNVGAISPEQYDSDLSELIRPQKFDCNKCTASYSSDRRLQCHIQRVHPNHVCVMCGEIFKASIHLLSHQRKHQALAKELVFPCNVCGDNVSDVKKHMDMHRARNDKVSANNGLVLKTVNGKRPGPKRQLELAKVAKLSVESDRSGKIGGKSMIKTEKISPNSSLVATNDRSNDTSKKPITYPAAAKKIKSEGNPTITPSVSTATPQSIPNGNGPTQRNKECPICNKKFTKRARLIQHVKIHNGDYVECELCPHKILKKNYMPVHMKKYHNTETSSNATAPSDLMAVTSPVGDTNGSYISSHQSIPADLFNDDYAEYLHDENSQITEYSSYLGIADDNMHESMHVEEAILSAINTDDNMSSNHFPQTIASQTSDSMRLAMESSLMCNFQMI